MYTIVIVSTFLKLSTFSCDVLTPQTQVTVAEHAKKEGIGLAELKSSEQADLIRWCSQFGEADEREKHMIHNGPARDAKYLGALLVD